MKVISQGSLEKLKEPTEGVVGLSPLSSPLLSSFTLCVCERGNERQRDREAEREILFYFTLRNQSSKSDSIG